MYQTQDIWYLKSFILWIVFSSFKSGFHRKFELPASTFLLGVQGIELMTLMVAWPLMSNAYPVILFVNKVIPTSIRYDS